MIALFKVIVKVTEQFKVEFWALKDNVIEIDRIYIVILKLLVDPILLCSCLLCHPSERLIRLYRSSILLTVVFLPTTIISLHHQWLRVPLLFNALGHDDLLLLMQWFNFSIVIVVHSMIKLLLSTSRILRWVLVNLLIHEI